MSSAVVDIDPTALDGWSGVDACAELLSVVVDARPLVLRCETEGPHDEHEATLRWVGDARQERVEG